VAALRPDLATLDTSLALLFIVDAIGIGAGEARDHWPGGRPALAPLRALRDGADWDVLRLAAAGAQALAATGRAVAASDGEVGPASLDEPHALAQEAFRRFSAEVVAPQAEAIHRHDLTVPESLLQPMRDMGVFGLAIPSGSAAAAPTTARTRC
jgi:(2S)-methylsuccinyl-CoA dehydrogenase